MRTKKWTSVQLKEWKRRRLVRIMSCWIWRVNVIMWLGLALISSIILLQSPNIWTWDVCLMCCRSVFVFRFLVSVEHFWKEYVRGCMIVFSVNETFMMSFLVSSATWTFRMSSLAGSDTLAKIFLTSTLSFHVDGVVPHQCFQAGTFIMRLYYFSHYGDFYFSM